MLRHIGTQVEAMLSQQISLKIHMRAIERQLAAIAVRICDHDAMLLPRSIFLLLEMGSRHFFLPKSPLRRQGALGAC